MKAILSILILFFLLNEISAQETDSLREQSLFRSAWDTAMADGLITPEERALMDILVKSLVLSVDSTRVWETRWSYKIPQSLDQSGRWPLVLQNIAIGAGLYGWGIPYVLHADDSRWYTGGVMMSTGGAFYLTYKYTKNREVSHARAQMMRYGSLLGLRYGLGVNEIFGLDGGDTEDRKTLWAWTLMASVPVGHYGGEYLFKKYDPSNGQAWAWTMWTGVAGLTARSLHTVISPAPELPENSSYYHDDQQWERYNAEKADWQKQKTITELMAYPLGVYAGYQLSKDKQYSFGDALMLFQGWSFGYVNSMMLQSIFLEDDSSGIFFLMNDLGAIGSALLYDKWIRADDFNFGQATLMFLGSASGTAFGFGTAVLLNITDKEPLLILALSGYGAGTYLTRQILKVGPDGAIAQANTNRLSLRPTVIPAWGSDNKVSLIPAIDLKVRFK